MTSTAAHYKKKAPLGYDEDELVSTTIPNGGSHASSRKRSTLAGASVATSVIPSLYYPAHSKSSSTGASTTLRTHEAPMKSASSSKPATTSAHSVSQRKREIEASYTEPQEPESDPLYFQGDEQDAEEDAAETYEDQELDDDAYDSRDAREDEDAEVDEEEEVEEDEEDERDEEKVAASRRNSRKPQIGVPASAWTQTAIDQLLIALSPLKQLEQVTEVSKALQSAAQLIETQLVRLNEQMGRALQLFEEQRTIPTPAPVVVADAVPSAQSNPVTVAVPALSFREELSKLKSQRAQEAATSSSKKTSGTRRKSGKRADSTATTEENEEDQRSVTSNGTAESTHAAAKTKSASTGSGGFKVRRVTLQEKKQAAAAAASAAADTNETCIAADQCIEAH